MHGTCIEIQKALVHFSRNSKYVTRFKYD